MSWEPEVEDIVRRRELGGQMGGPELIAQHHADGKLTVRERIDLLIDKGSFNEQGRLAGVGVYEEGRLAQFFPSGTVVGAARIDGRRVIISGSDFTARRAPAVAGRQRNKGSYAEEMALEMKRRAVEKYQKRAPEFAKWLDLNVDEGLTIYQFPKEHRKKLRTSNGIERMNKEIKRRTRVAVLFPNPASALRLVTGVIIEIHEEWVTGKQYLDMNPLLNQNLKNE